VGAAIATGLAAIEKVERPLWVGLRPPDAAHTQSPFARKEIVMESENVVVVHRVPWNKGKLTGQKPPLKLREIWAIRTRLQRSSNVRELAMFDLAIDS